MAPPAPTTRGLLQMLNIQSFLAANAPRAQAPKAPRKSTKGTTGRTIAAFRAHHTRLSNKLSGMPTTGPGSMAARKAIRADMARIQASISALLA